MNLKSVFLFALLLLSHIGLNAAIADTPSDNGAKDDVIGKMGDIEIRRAELQKMLGPLPTQATDKDTLRLAVVQSTRTELLRRLVLAELTRAAWDKRPEVQAEIERAREQVLVASFVNDKSRPPVSYPSEAEIKIAYDTNAKRFIRPAQVHISQIYIPDGARPDDLGKKVREPGASFANLARTYSKHADSAAKGGDMGWIAEDAVIPEIRTALSSMNSGDISKPIKSQMGWHIVKLDGRKPAAQQSLAEVHDQLVQSMRLQQAQENEQRYLNKLAEDNPISINEIALGALLK